MTTLLGLLREIYSQPAWLAIWVTWLMAVNSAAILFLARREAGWVLAAWLGNVATMTWLYHVNGFNRLLGLSHVLWWTPLLVYLWHRRRDFAGAAAAERWLRVVLVTNVLSLVVDYLDVARYLAGDRV